MKKQWCWLNLLVLVMPLLLVACGGGGERAIQKTVEELAPIIEDGLNRRDLSAVEPYFATPAEGANAAGLKETQEALRKFAASLTSSDRVQFHDFAVENVSVHESGGLARASYRLHFSIIRNSTVVYGAVMTQDMALLKTARGWRVSGGDQPQLSEVTGRWPPPGA